MSIQNVKEITEELGLTWKGDFMDALSDGEPADTKDNSEE